MLQSAKPKKETHAVGLKTSANLSKLHYQIIPFIIGALGIVRKKLKEHLLKLNIKENRIKTTTRKLQKAAILGSVRVMKTFMNK